MKRRDDSGFTIIELLISILILGIVFGVVSASFIISLKITGESTTRLLESQDGAFTSAYLVKDIQSAETVAPLTSACGSAIGSPVLKVLWAERLSTGTINYKVDYRYQSSTAKLVRYSCDTNSSTTTVASQLKVIPQLKCDAVVITVPSTCVSPKTVTMTLTDAVDGSFAIKAFRRLG